MSKYDSNLFMQHPAETKKLHKVATDCNVLLSQITELDVNTHQMHISQMST